MSATHLSLIPHVSEKAYGLSTDGTYVFKVPTTANKQQVASAVAAQYDVKIADVRMVVVKGKVKRTVRNGKQYEGQRKDTKKAYVTLVEGNSIKIFDEEEAK